VRNIRATNSVVDFCYTLDGRLGGFINTRTRVWDVVPVALMLPEAGGRLSDLQGREIIFEGGAHLGTRTFAVVGASEALHPSLLSVVDPGCG
jgi:myo-inositol-1(or 4)-monophosphatase